MRTATVGYIILLAGAIIGDRVKVVQLLDIMGKNAPLRFTSAAKLAV